jgi:hypothetical protein
MWSERNSLSASSFCTPRRPGRLGFVPLFHNVDSAASSQQREDKHVGPGDPRRDCAVLGLPLRVVRRRRAAEPAAEVAANSMVRCGVLD